MSKISRKIERAALRRRARELHDGADAIRRLTSATDGLTSISEAIALLRDVGPAIEECRNATVLAIQHAVALERALDRERFIRETLTKEIGSRFARSGQPDGSDLEQIAQAAGDIWDKHNPAPPIEGSDVGGP